MCLLNTSTGISPSISLSNCLLLFGKAATVLSPRVFVCANVRAEFIADFVKRFLCLLYFPQLPTHRRSHPHTHTPSHLHMLTPSPREKRPEGSLHTPLSLVKQDLKDDDTNTIIPELVHTHTHTHTHCSSYIFLVHLKILKIPCTSKLTV